MTNTKFRMKDTKIYNQKGTYIRASILHTGIRINIRVNETRQRAEVNPSKYGQMIFNKEAKIYQQGKNGLSFQQMVQ